MNDSIIVYDGASKPPFDYNEMTERIRRMEESAIPKKSPKEDDLQPSEEIKPEIYISVDVEANGPVPGLNSMLSFGATAIDISKTIHNEFFATLHTLPGSVEDPETTKWWASSPENKEAYWLSRANQKPIQKVMYDFNEFIVKVSKDKKAVFVAGPTGFDWPFITYYMHHAKGRKHVLHPACLDIRSYVAGMTKSYYRSVGKGSYPKEWFDNLPHTHHPLEDAREQAVILMNAMRQNKGLPFVPISFKEGYIPPITR